ncbi:RagB/SusD family nutrient uptake outer membrane protein [Flavobacterium frigidimaris]|uniref:RagB/SusD family nutrient uptake outer membrane protein n=1 Tax=Flavobacterium frigidimaris TaxID=262320 RepID=A0ABX4BR83_FLAFR|nr:RagB/SusD family nutrient uptake outer membrane protein [Flavobacterium frigidimaris]OXA79108.1 RagB/SusD family nutrient uptake outer membrane protein [Flavobacterium frigidimaris]
MKPIQIKTFMVTAMITLFLGACSNVLEEEPRSIYTPEYFKTEKGVVGGLTSMYAHLRYIYGQGYYYNTTETGTDEATYAQSADGNFKDMDLSGVGSITPSSSRTDALWQPAFININTASGIIENAQAIGTISNAMISEARFFRAFDYFQLVQTFGGVPLDLGAGELKFNTSPSRFSVRNTVPQVYTKAIFPDLVIAANELPDVGRVKGGVTKTAARLFLAKAYLTYAWWLKNPNNIPTYPEATRVDPDGHDAAWYFQKAYDVAAAGIDSHGSFALQPTYYDVNLGSNDRNSEILLYADHTEKSEFFNASSLTYSNGAAPENFAVWMMTPNYTNLRSSGVSSVQREAEQHLGRPYIRMCPTIGVIANTFADKTNDSRYDGTFTTVYRGNWNKAGVTNATLNNANGLPVAPGGAILSFLNAENPSIVYNASNGGVGAGVLAGRSDFVIAPSGISRIIYPGLWKLGVYRTDGAGGLGQPNAASTRPYNIAKLSELYLIAAEAAVMGATPQGGKSARELVNVLRARAGKWRFDNNGNVAKSADNSAAMIAATPATIDINYILAERSREYYGEGYRWFDLLRTQKWAELSGSYQICGTAYGDHTPVTVARDIKPYHYLRPIPQSQFDAMIMTAEEKAAYQNPGY